jgi:hypothetical protein
MNKDTVTVYGQEVAITDELFWLKMAAASGIEARQSYATLASAVAQNRIANTLEKLVALQQTRTESSLDINELSESTRYINELVENILNSKKV